MKIDVCRDVEGALECAVDMTGCVWMGSKAPGTIGDKLLGDTWSGPAHKVHGLKTSSVGFFSLLGYPLQLHHVYPQSPFDAN